MASEQTFSIGAMTIGITYDSALNFWQRRPFSIFSSDSQAQVHLDVLTHPVPRRPSGQPVFDPGQAWLMYREGNQQVIWARSHYHDPNMVGVFAPDFLSGSIFTSESVVSPGNYRFPLSFPIGELLLTNLLGTGYGVMLHSCGVIDGETGLVFTGISTAGKTTTARLWNGLPGVSVVNDDHTIIRRIDGQFRVYGTPWHGQGGMALAEDAPLRKILILKHAPANQAVRLPPARAAAALLVRTFAPLWSAPAMEYTLQFLDELCQVVPCYELGFVPDRSAVDYVRWLSED